MAIAIVGSATRSNFAGTASPTLNYPSGLQNGDLLLAIIGSAATCTISSTTGWNSLGYQAGGSDSGYVLLWRIYASEGSSWTFTNLFTTSQTGGGGVIIAYRGVNQSAPINQSGHATSTSGAQSGPSLTPDVDNCMFVQLMGCDPSTSAYSGTPDTSPVATERYDAKDSNSYAYIYIQEYQQGTAAALALDATVTSDSYARYQVAIAPEAGPPPDITGTSAVTAAQAVLVAVGALVFAGTAAVSANQATVAAEAAQVFSGQSAVTASAASLAAAGAESFEGQAALIAQQATFAATGTVEGDIAGIADLIATQAKVAAAAEEQFLATAVLAAESASLEAAGSEVFAGQAALSALQATLAAQGSEIFAGQAALAATQAAVASEGFPAFLASAPLVSSPASLAAAGLEKFEGQSTLAASMAALAAQGAETFSGAAALVSQPAAVVASGGEAFAGVSALVPELAALAASGGESFAGQAALVAVQAEVTGAGAETFEGAAAPVAEAAIVAASGLIEGAIADITGTAELVAEPARIAGVGTTVEVHMEVGHVDLVDRPQGTVLLDDVRRESVEPPLPGATLEVRDGQLL